MTNPILTMFLGWALYFCVGLIRDWAATMFYRSVSREWAGSASILSGGITLFDIIVVATVIRSNNWILAGMYAIGTGVGTLIAMKNTRRRR